MHEDQSLEATSKIKDFFYCAILFIEFVSTNLLFIVALNEVSIITKPNHCHSASSIYIIINY